MKRRDFLKTSAAVLPFALGGFSLKAYGRSPWLDALTNAAAETDRVFVLIQLSGGNDGLNTLVPLDQYGAYAAARSNIALPENSLLKLRDETGLHPAMTGLHNLYTQDKVRVVQSVGYPSPNFSHFRSTDIWLTGANSEETLNTGVLGRYLYQEFPTYPTDYPTVEMPHPLAIQIGSAVSIGLDGPLANMGMAFSTSDSFYQLAAENVDPAPDSRYGRQLSYIRTVGEQILKFAEPVYEASRDVQTLSTLYPAPGMNPLADQLRVAARLIGGGLKTRVYIVNLTGFDTHAVQVNMNNRTEGSHAELLGYVSTAIHAFQDDLEKMGQQDRVVGMTFSEFGRRIMSNASFGTDHGAAAPLFVFGTNVIPGVLGDNPYIPTAADVEDNIPMQYDFRSVYASILQDWFGVESAVLREIMYADYHILPIIKKQASAVREEEAAFADLRNYPNPFGINTSISFESTGRHVRLAVFDGSGREISTLIDRRVSPGAHTVEFNARHLPAGTYYYRLQSGAQQETRAMHVVR